MQVSPIISSISPTFFINISHYSSSSMCSSSSDDFAEISAIFPNDFSGKLKLDVSDTQITEKSIDEESFDDCNNHDEKQQQQQQQHREEEESEEEEEESEDDEDEEEFEFSFVSTDHDGSPVSAEDIFSNGEIRPIFPLFNRDLLFAGGYDGDLKGSSNESTLRPPLRKVFVEKRDLPSTSSSSSGTNDSEERPVGEYCVWRGKAVEASPEVCKKSNSTGFSKLWRFRDLLHRSSSDGKDAFVFFQETTKPNQRNEKVVKIVKVEKREVSTEKRNASEVKTKTERKIAGAGENVKAKGAKGKTASLSPHEKHYARNRAMKEENRRRSYLPYRQDLVGFFTNVNGLSRNVHPF